MYTNSPFPTQTTPKEPGGSESKLTKFKNWLKKHWIAVSIITGATIITIVFVVALYHIDAKREEAQYNIKVNQKFFSKLTGLQVADEEAVKQPVTAVMIENSPDARPQSGLKQAGVIYEAVAEGGITRFMALYQQEKAELIGPVRSLRMYYLDWATPYQASIAHVGGSGNALSAVQDGKHRDIDQSYNASSYWRANDRYAPHNVYTNSEKLDALNASKKYHESNFTSFKRAKEKPAETPDANRITVNFSSDLYNTSYSYNPKNNTYSRSLAGSPHKDREKGQITPKVIVVIKVKTKSRAGSPYEDLVTSGSGQAYIFQNGTIKKATWKKDSHKAPLRLIDEEGESVALNRGQTWISAITDRGSVSWK